MTEFRRLVFAAVISGVLAGLVWFGLQYATVVPLIENAEWYEEAAAHAAGEHHHEEGWHPQDGWQRNLLTALSTTLVGIAFASLLLGWIRISGARLNLKSGLLWGLAGFVCVTLAPALQFPPEPPGVAVADLGERQILWVATVITTAAGLHLLLQRSHTWSMRLLGIVLLILPHAVKPPSPSGSTVVPETLIRQFTFASLATAALFWMTLGSISGWLQSRFRLSE